MKTIERVLYLTEKGQVTLPIAWRRRVGTNAVRISEGVGDRLQIVPIETKEDNETGWVSVFDKNRDNHGKGLSASEFLRTLRNIREKEDGSKRDKK